MKDKLFSVITILVLMMLLITACTPAAAPATAEPNAVTGPGEPGEIAKPTPITITFWSGLGTPDNVPMAAMVKEFNETNTDGITVEVTELDWSTLYSKLVLDFKTGNAPDVSTSHQTNILMNQSLGILQPIDDLVKKVGFDTGDFVDSAWQGTMIDGKQFAIPNDMHPMALYYNVKMFNDAGLDPTKPPTNNAEFLEYARKLTVDSNGDGTPEQYGIGLGYSGGGPFRTWMSLVWQHKGADILSTDKKTATFNNQAGIESLQFLYDLVYVEKVSPPAEQDPDDDFMKGNTAMVITGPWAIGDFNKIEGLDYKTAMIPVIYDQPAAWGNSHTYVFPDNKKPEKTEAAMKFVKWMLDHNFEWSRDSGHQPVRKSVIASTEFKELENWQAFAETVPFGHYYPAIVKFNDVFSRDPTSPFVMMMESVMLDQTSVPDAIATAEKSVNDILAQD